MGLASAKGAADLAFGRHTVLPALDSTFSDRASQAGRTQALRVRLKAVPAGQFDAWVTHQPNISAFTGQGAAMGETLILGTSGQLLARSHFG